jgi:hypothetical protein
VPALPPPPSAVEGTVSPPPTSTPLPVPPPPTPPPPTPTPPQQTAQAQPALPLPLPPPPVPPPPAPPSHTSQPNPTKNAVAESTELNNTLEKLRALQRQKEAPKARYNPPRGGAPNSGGSPQGDITMQLSAQQRGLIGEKVRECWTKDAGALDLENMSVILAVKTRPGGIVFQADVGQEDQARMSDPRFRAFAERAIRAVMDPRCATLPLPKDKLAQVNELTFRFRP